MLKDNFMKHEIQCSIIIQEVNEEASRNAKKYDMSESKAAYIEEIIKNNQELKFEDLKDKSIGELEDLKVLEEAPKDENNDVTPAPEETHEVVNDANNEVRNDPPSDPTDTSGVWCTWNSNRSAGSTYYYDKQIDQAVVHQQILERLNLTDMWSTIGDYYTGGVEPRSSYCLGYFFKITTLDTIYDIVVDSVTGRVIEEKTAPTPKPKYTEQQAIEILLNYNNALMENTKDTYAYFSTDKHGFPDGPVYRYSVSINMKDGTRYNGSVNAITGEVYSAVTEHY